MATSARQRADPVPVLSSAVAFTLWTDDPALAARADAAGVERIGVDLERSGKHERQAGRGTFISTHREEALDPLARVLRRGALFARTEPLHRGTRPEVERLLARGVGVLMLPMFRSAGEVEEFAGIVAGRATVVLLLETREALAALEAILDVDGVDEVHIGLNDLSIALELPNRFLVLTGRAVARAAALVRAAGLPLGVGGVGRLHDERLPIPPDLIYAQLARLGATRTLISRAFLGSGPGPIDLGAELARSRARLAELSLSEPAELERARRRLVAATQACPAW